MVKIKELSKTKGNCFSCGNLRKFIPCGHFECLVLNPEKGDATLTETNRPLKTDCEWWTGFTERKVWMAGNQLMSIENKRDVRQPQFIRINFIPYIPITEATG